MFVNPKGNGAPWGQADEWSKATEDWIPLSDQLPWSEDDGGPPAPSLMFVPVKPAGEKVLNGCTILEYPIDNEAIAAAATPLGRD